MMSDSLGVALEYQVPDVLWERMKPLLPKPKPKIRAGRPRMDDRQAMTAIFYILRTGCQWKALSRSLRAANTVHGRFQRWREAGVFERLWRAGLMADDQRVGIGWEWQALDGAMTKAPLGGKGTGPNPTDRGKSATKRTLVTEGNGIPLAVAVAGANRHDMKMTAGTLHAIVIPRPAPSAEAPRNLSLDKGFDFDEACALVTAWGYTAHIRTRGEEANVKK